MPLKWKIYYLFALLLLAWCAAMAIIIVYTMVAPHWSISNPAVTIPLAALMLAILSLQAIFGLRFIRHFKNNSVFTDWEKKWSYNINILCIILSAILCLGVIFNFGSMLKQRLPTQIISNISILMASISAVYLCLTRNALVEEISKQYLGSVDNIGQDISTNN